MDLNRGGFLEYKCRRCGVVKNEFHAPNGFEAFLAISKNGSTPEEWGPCATWYGTHICDDKHLSITDFIGIKYDSPKA
ncbi:hypothetical protein [Brevibacillus laterosporus]|uniref:hypothetical protein n=1 Tax=Brevibacillus laterosporus TaxID=1465 RepID=UPI0026512F30|nr:hypothetical protein [Brevibacillus laterosporus]MDN9012400.1 hypothetical protein [Brevibacillus laterosporus]MDO0943537.1 hypothetical protein [Brevibacillus laterosporus]